MVKSNRTQRPRQRRIVLGDSELGIRLEANNKETLARGLARLVQLLGAENLDNFRTPDGPGRYEDWLLYFKWMLGGPDVDEEVTTPTTATESSASLDNTPTAAGSRIGSDLGQPSQSYNHLYHDQTDPIAPPEPRPIPPKPEPPSPSPSKAKAKAGQLPHTVSAAEPITDQSQPQSRPQPQPRSEPKPKKPRRVAGQSRHGGAEVAVAIQRLREIVAEQQGDQQQLIDPTNQPLEDEEYYLDIKRLGELVAAKTLHKKDLELREVAQEINSGISGQSLSLLRQGKWTSDATYYFSDLCRWLKVRPRELVKVYPGSEATTNPSDSNSKMVATASSTVTPTSTGPAPVAPAVAARWSVEWLKAIASNRRNRSWLVARSLLPVFEEVAKDLAGNEWEPGPKSSD